MMASEEELMTEEDAQLAVDAARRELDACVDREREARESVARALVALQEAVEAHMRAALSALSRGGE
jgi:hypothetical protein